MYFRRHGGGAIPGFLCSDGRVFRLEGQRFQPEGQLPDAVGLTAGTTVWAWGGGGVWRREGGTWRRVFSGDVTAAAAQADWLAWSDGRTVLVGRDGVPMPVAGTLEGVRSLAWQNKDLVVVDDRGVRRSGGGLLPWRPLLAGAGEISALSGHGHRLWLVRSDGHIIDSTVPRSFATVAERSRRFRRRSARASGNRGFAERLVCGRRHPEPPHPLVQ